MIPKTTIEKFCLELQDHSYCPIIRPQPVQGLIDLVILQAGVKKKASLIQQVLEEIPCRAFLDENAGRRARVEKQYDIPTFGVLSPNDALTSLIQTELVTNCADYQTLDSDERNVCARLRVVYREVRPEIDKVIVAVLPPYLLNSRVYDVLCPQDLSNGIVRGIGLAVLNPPKQNNRTIIYNRARRAEDVPELHRLADDLDKQNKNGQG